MLFKKFGLKLIAPLSRVQSVRARNSYSLNLRVRSGLLQTVDAGRGVMKQGGALGS